MGSPVTIDEIVQPTIRDSALAASVAAGLVALVGWATVTLLAWKSRAESRE